MPFTRDRRKSEGHPPTHTHACPSPSTPWLPSHGRPRRSVARPEGSCLPSRGPGHRGPPSCTSCRCPFARRRKCRRDTRPRQTGGRRRRAPRRVSAWPRVGGAPPCPSSDPPHLNKQGDLLKDALLRAGRGKHPVKAELVADVVLALPANVGLRGGGGQNGPRCERCPPLAKHFSRNSGTRSSPPPGSPQTPPLPPFRRHSPSMRWAVGLYPSPHVSVCVCVGGGGKPTSSALESTRPLLLSAGKRRWLGGF